MRNLQSAKAPHTYRKFLTKKAKNRFLPNKVDSFWPQILPRWFHSVQSFYRKSLLCFLSPVTCLYIFSTEDDIFTGISFTSG